ncbi:MAG: hypothetical protein JWQ16_3348 [Novosphingobium sp.]|nr:hypothetical protein [Novosphingobium sp.]
MTFVEAIKTGLSKFVTWKGRASRSEFWFFFLFAFACMIVATIIDKILGTSFKTVNPITGLEQSAGYGYVYGLVALVLLLPNLAVMVRRLHDTGRSGWWYWIALIPLVGAILLLVWFASKGTTGSNEYGEDPLGGELTAAFS